MEKKCDTGNWVGQKKGYSLEMWAIKIASFTKVKNATCAQRYAAWYG